MRTLFSGTAHPSAIAKSLKRTLAKHDVVRGINKCEHAVAGMFGYRNWHELTKVCLASAQESPRDDALAPAAVAARNAGYAAAIVQRLEISPEMAALVVGEMQPSGRRLPVLASANPKEGEKQGFRTMSTLLGTMLAEGIVRRETERCRAAGGKRSEKVKRADVAVGAFFEGRRGIFVREVLEIYDSNEGRRVYWADDITRGACSIAHFVRWAKVHVAAPPAGWRRADNGLAPDLQKAVAEGDLVAAALRFVGDPDQLRRLEYLTGQRGRKADRLAIPNK